MAETSGFFDAVYDESSGSYDLEYFAAQFAAYFALFVGNGVFGSPTNQLRVSSGDGMTIKVSPGWAFINGYWYYNDEEMTLSVASNLSSSSRYDAVLCRWDAGSRRISIAVQTGSTRVTRDGSFYDLKLAELSVPAGSSYVPQSNITDTRMNESVCGFVTGLLNVQTTEDLFAQYDAVFSEWFSEVQGQITADMAVQLQQRIGNLNELITTQKSSLVSAVNEVESDVEGMKNGTVTVERASSAETASSATTANSANTANSATTAGSAGTAGTADKLSTARKINGVEFDGTKDITIYDSSKPSVIYSTTEPNEVPENTLVFVYE